MTGGEMLQARDLRVYMAQFLVEMSQRHGQIEQMRLALDLDDRKDAAKIEDQLDTVEEKFCELYHAVGEVLGQVKPMPPGAP